MAGSCKITVLDVNNNAINGVTIVLDGSSGTTSSAGTLSLSFTESNNGHQITFSHSYYVTEEVRFRGTLREGEWNNALAQRTDTNGPSFTIRLGRCATAPTILKSDDEVDALAGSDVHAAVLFDLPRAPGKLAYRFQYNDPLPIELAEPILLPQSPPLAGTTGWRRFMSSPADPPADIMSRGRFFWLIYPASPQDPQYAIAVWSPNINSSVPLKDLDMIVFYSPHTAAYTATYPFGITKNTKPGDQAYMTLGKKYLQDEYGFAYNLIARKRRAIMVMPICRAGDWGPFSSQEGVFRLCREVSLFLHRECRTSNLGLTTTGGLDQRLWLAGGSLRSPGVGIWSSDFGTPPPPGRIILSAFSTGVAPYKAVIGSWSLNGFESRVWGCPRDVRAGGEDPSEAFAKAWEEVWDLDGFHPKTGGWLAYLDQLSGWYNARPNRKLRLCHSQGRSQPNPKTDTHRLWKILMGEGNKGVTVDRSLPSTPPIGGARELQGKRWSIVNFDSSYVENNPAVGVPPLGDTHHATPKVGFSHCASLSDVGKV